MKNILNAYQVFIEWLQKLIIAIACVLVGLDILFIFIEVASRYLLGSSQAVLEEFPRLLLPLVIFPMMGVLLKMKRHISVELLPEKLTGKKLALLMVVVYATVLVLAIQFFIAGVSTVQYFHSIGFEIQGEVAIKRWIVYLPFPIGFAVLGLFAVDMLIRELAALKKPTKEGMA
jgi:C4-dicarboxylate transporter DctQ subunit